MGRKYPIRLPDEQYYFDLVSCMSACPVNTNAGGYVREIGAGNLRRSFELAAGPNPLASVCARICAHPCEQACRRGKLDKPISIRALKRVATEYSGVERPLPDHRPLLEHYFELCQRPLPRDVGKGRKVAVVGGGPAGLGCAHDLALMGYAVTVFEAAPVAGGMMVLGIPEYRLPRDVVRAEVNRLADIGVTILTGQKLGTHYRLKGLLREGFEAVFLGIGLGRGRELRVPGAGLDRVMNGIDFLINVNLGYRVELGERIAVLGGGNVAMDVARTALRVAESDEREGATMLDVARTARRLGAHEVLLFSLEKRSELPADPLEVEEAMAEGIVLHPSRGIREIKGEGRASAVVTHVCERVFDEKGRFSPAFRANSDEEWPVDSVILAVGQAPDPEVLDGEPEIERTPQGTVKINPETLATTMPGVFAGGDVAFGPRILITAVADGKKAAAGIHRYLSQGEARPRRAMFATARMERGLADYDRVPRHEPPVLPTNRRTGFTEVERVYDPETARAEADRCLWCHVSPVFDSSRCILCGGCVDICPERCLAIVPAESLASTESLERLIEAKEARGCGAAIIKDETICIRCGLCARRCPTRAITMEKVVYEEG